MVTKPRRASFRILVSCIGIFSLACGSESIAPEVELFNLGTLVYDEAEFVTSSHPAWVVPDTILAYHSYNSTFWSGTLKILNLSTGSMRILDDPTNGMHLMEGPTRRLAAITGDSTVYHTYGFYLRAASLQDGSVVTVDSFCSDLVLRLDESALAYRGHHSADSIALLHLSPRSRGAVPGWGDLLTFSLDGWEILLQDVDDQIVRLHIVTEAQVTVWPPPNSAEASVVAARWDSQGIRLLIHFEDHFQIVDPESGTGVDISVARGEDIDHSIGEWSADGEYIAFWTEQCVAAAYACVTYRRTVYVANAATGEATPLAVTEHDHHDPLRHHSSGTLLFSSDGRGLYYSVLGRLYVAHVP